MAMVPGLQAPSSAAPLSTLIGQQLLTAGKLTEDEVLRVVTVQRERKMRFGEVAVDLGFVTAADVNEILARQFSYPVVSLEESGFSPLLVTATQPMGVQAEAFRRLRSQLLLRWFSDRQKSIAVTSCHRGHGSSVLAANLAILFAQLGERTLLIDANLRKPSQMQLFGLQPSTGLTDVLMGRSETGDVVHPIAAFESLFLLGAGASPPNPQELLSRVPFHYLIETAPANFDIVIVDTPPILQYADAQIVAALTKACVLAIKRNETRVSEINDVRTHLQPTAAELVGAVIFD
jgi:protein-tyrosine kinase